MEFVDRDKGAEFNAVIHSFSSPAEFHHTNDRTELSSIGSIRAWKREAQNNARDADTLRWLIGRKLGAEAALKEEMK